MFSSYRFAWSNISYMFCKFCSCISSYFDQVLLYHQVLKTLVLKAAYTCFEKTSHSTSPHSSSHSTSYNTIHNGHKFIDRSSSHNTSPYSGSHTTSTYITNTTAINPTPNPGRRGSVISSPPAPHAAVILEITHSSGCRRHFPTSQLHQPSCCKP
jgi:hypothetical protein